VVSDLAQQVPEGYKQTEVGVIPEDWEACELGSLAPFIGSGKTNTNNKGEYPLFGSTGKIGSCETPEYNGDALLVARVGANAGRLNFVTGKYGVSDNTIIVRVEKNSNIDYFKYQLVKKNLNSLVFGSGQPLITGSQLKVLLVPVPKKKEQTAIAHALSDVDTLITSIEKLITKKRDIKTAAMQQLLTGKKRLPPFDQKHTGYKQTELGEIPDDWEVNYFSDIAAPNNNRTNPKITGGGDFCIELEHVDQRTGTINGSALTTSKSSLKNIFSEGDVLFGKLRSYLRKYWLTNRSGVCSTEILVFKANEQRAISQFIFQIVQTDSFIDCTSESYGTHMPRSDWKVVKSFVVATPSIEEQLEISCVLSDMDDEVDALERRLNKTQQLKQGMMQELLTGKTRLPFDKH
jgi:type I restriction enzyme S subunit